MSQTIGERLKLARRNANMTQKQLATAVDAKQGAISDLENGRNNSSTKIVEMALALGVNPKWLASGQGKATAGTYDINNPFIYKDFDDSGIPVYGFELLAYVLKGEDVKPVGYEPCVEGTDKEGLFWTTISDNSMSPTFSIGDRVMFSKRIKPKPAHYVLATIEDTDVAVLRKWKPMGFDEVSAKSYDILESENTYYPAIDGRFTPFSINAVAYILKKKLV